MARGESRLSQYTLEEVQGQFQSWRAQRKKGQRIPEELWKAAIGLYSHYSIYKIARALRLDHMDLKERINRIGKGKLPAKHEPHFIEFPFSNGAVNTSECTLKVKARRRSRIDIKVKGTGVAPVLEALSGLLSDNR